MNGYVIYNKRCKAWMGVVLYLKSNANDAGMNVKSQDSVSLVDELKLWLFLLRRR